MRTCWRPGLSMRLANILVTVRFAPRVLDGGYCQLSDILGVVPEGDYDPHLLFHFEIWYTGGYLTRNFKV